MLRPYPDFEGCEWNSKLGDYQYVCMLLKWLLPQQLSPHKNANFNKTNISDRMNGQSKDQPPAKTKKIISTNLLQPHAFLS